jgi:hypothetical protein
METLKKQKQQKLMENVPFTGASGAHDGNKLTWCEVGIDIMQKSAGLDIRVLLGGLNRNFVLDVVKLNVKRHFRLLNNEYAVQISNM